MSVKVRIPTPLREITKDQDVVEVMPGTVSEVLNNLQTKYPGVKDRLCNNDGTIRRFVNIYVNNEDIRFKDGLDTVIKDGFEVSIIPSIAGG